MNISDRINSYKAIEDYRGKPLIVYATSTRQGVGAMLAGDAVREFIDQMDMLNHHDSIDIMLHSTGGDALAAWNLVSILRERFSNISILVPFTAFSAATIFCLGADEIVMHPNASLGPIDPQITIQLPDGSQRHFAFEDLGAFLRFLKVDADISQESHISEITKQLFKVVDPVNVGAAKRASELATDVGERILQMHMDKDDAKRIAVNLNKSFFAHSDAVSRKRAKALGLKIADSDEKLEALMWDAYLALEDYMKFRKPFIPLQCFIEGGGGPSIQPVAPINMPPNTPPQLANNIWTQAGNTVLATLGNSGYEVDYDLVNAALESVRLISAHKTIGKLSASRQLNGEIRVSGTNHSSGWRNIDMPQESGDESENASKDEGKNEDVSQETEKSAEQ